MPFSRITVSPVEGLFRDDIIRYAGIGPASSFISINAREIEKVLRTLPQVEQVHVFKHFPDRLEIMLEGRKAAALALAMSGGRIVPVYLDASGVIFRVGDFDTLPDLPIVSGIMIEDPVPGMRLPAAFSSFFSELDTLSIRAPELLNAVSEIRINRKSPDGFDLIVYPVHRQISVRLSELNEDLLRYTLLLVDVLASRENGVRSIDFRSGMVSYKLNTEVY
jgi:cell division protein FtsQ